MYDENLKDLAIYDLEQKAISISNAIQALTAQGYIINSAKRVKLDWSSILLHAFENIDVLTSEQQSNIEVLYNKIYA